MISWSFRNFHSFLKIVLSFFNFNIHSRFWKQQMTRRSSFWSSCLRNWGMLWSWFGFLLKLNDFLFQPWTHLRALSLFVKLFKCSRRKYFCRLRSKSFDQSFSNCLFFFFDLQLLELRYNPSFWILLFRWLSLLLLALSSLNPIFFLLKYCPFLLSSFVKIN